MFRFKCAFMRNKLNIYIYGCKGCMCVYVMCVYVYRCVYLCIYIHMGVCECTLCVCIGVYMCISECVRVLFATA